MYIFKHQMITRANDMWAEAHKDTLGFRFRLAWGRRREGPSLPAPPLSLVPNNGESEPTVKYPLYEVFDTQEQASARAAIRNRGKDIPVPPTASETRE
jgi:hypothetical protein